jgi:2-hydroxychromene-2-carboxylate isomerase
LKTHNKTAKLAEKPSYLGNIGEYWFTCGSTYNYLTVNRIEALAAQAGAALTLKPF